MSDQSDRDAKVEQTWREFLVDGDTEPERRWRDVLSLLPGDPRCRFCGSPLHGIGGTVARVLFDKRRSSVSPRLCNTCDDFAVKYQGGAEVELSMLFADIRGSTQLAEGMSASEFSRLINQFYVTASKVLESSDAWIDKLIGDEVAAFFFPGFTGPQHARQAVEAAQELLSATGHDSRDGPWVPVGVGVTPESHLWVRWWAARREWSRLRRWVTP
jgi:adenylate cyclase